MSTVRELDRVPRTLIVVLLLAVQGGDAVGQVGEQRPGVAVLPFDVLQMPPVDLSQSGLNFGLQEILSRQIEATLDLRIVERREMSAIMQEIGLHGSGNVDAATAARIGELVGARYMVGGLYSSWEGDLTVYLRLFSVETSERIHSVEIEREGGEGIAAVLRRASAELFDDLELPSLDVASRPARFNPPDEAVELFSHAIRRDEDGEPARAVETLTRILERWPEYDDARRLRDELNGDA